MSFQPWGLSAKVSTRNFAQWNRVCEQPKCFEAGEYDQLLKRNLVLGGVLGFGVIALIAGAIHPYRKVSATATTVPPIVEVVRTERKDVPIFGGWIGTLDGLVDADVRAQVTGYLSKQSYQEGSFVKKGQLQFQIDPRPFQAALDQTEGNCNVQQFLLSGTL